MDDELCWVERATGADSVRRGARLYSLWGGYGELFRVHLEGAGVATAIVKAVDPPRSVGGARAAFAHARKCRSYDVESAWYRGYAGRCDASCRVPALLAHETGAERWRFLLEDLDAAGFDVRRRRLDARGLEPCLAWLASLHARFLGVVADDLWPAGTYWHLATRPDELAATEDAALREAAPLIDERLRACPVRTLVHGDPKVANFCFSRDGASVAAVDFQYVGAGIGMQDVAYFLISATDSGSEALEPRHLDTYFRHLSRALGDVGSPLALASFEDAWRDLYALACADFYRFYAGWSPRRWEDDAVGRQIVQRVIRALG